MTITANAQPTKHFFIASSTRDLTLEDAILDLVDNSIDAYVRTHGIDVSPALLRAETRGPVSEKSPEEAPIRITMATDRVEIIDTCGGIDLASAQTHVFRFGRVDSHIESALGVYGIGLKRAIFKIGRRIVIESHTATEGFRVDIDVDQWANDESEGSWAFPLEVLGPAPSAKEAGTTVTITHLTAEVALRISDPVLFTRVHENIAMTYTLFLTRFLDVAFNGRLIEARPIPLGQGSDVRPAFKELMEDNVTVELTAALSARIDGTWNIERAGWYVLCNGRVIVAADKTDLTGWGVNGPQFVSKYRGFLGIAFFFSKDPSALPWTTTKRGLNQESYIYQLARKEMGALARPVLTFLNNMYRSEPAEELSERRIAEGLTAVDIKAVAAGGVRSFIVNRATRRVKPTTVSVQYRAALEEVDRIRRFISQPEMGAGAVGRHTFDYFLKMECPA